MSRWRDYLIGFVLAAAMLVLLSVAVANAGSSIWWVVVFWGIAVVIGIAFWIVIHEALRWGDAQ